MRAARIMKGITGPMLGLVLLAATIVGGTTEWYFGVGVLVVSLPFFILGYLAARCPHCGQVWWATPPWASADGVDQTADETDSMVCRRCHLDIGLGLRDP